MTAEREPASVQAERRQSAAEWLLRLGDRNATEEDVQAWLQWYAASEHNRKAFEEAQSFYTRMRAMSSAQRATLARSIKGSAQDVAQNVDRAHRTDGTSRDQWTRRRWTSFAAAASIAAIVLSLGIWGARSGYLFEAAPQELAYAAPIDHYRTVRLADGSEMVLSARAVAKVAFTRSARALEILQGAAYFQVKHDARRPFVVRAGEVSVTAVGTAFSVNRETDKLSVTVTQGSVHVDYGAGPDTADKSVRVETGGRALIPVATNSSRHRPSQSGTRDAGGQLPQAASSMQFFNVPLGEVIAAINARTANRISIDDPRVTDLNFSGTVLPERIDEWIAALPQIYPVRQVPLEDGSVTLVMRSDE